MKKCFPILAAGVLSCCFLSCNTNSAGGLSPAAQKNLDANNAITNSFASKDFSKLGDYVADDAVDHGGEGDVKGLANIKTALEKEMGGIDSEKTDIIKQLADDEYVMSWEHFTGIYKTAEMGHKAGDNMDLKILNVSKFKDGKAIEHWSLMAPADMMKMMSNMQPAQTSMSMDSTKKAK